MNTHRMPEHRRLSRKAPPVYAKGEVNQWVVGEARALQLIASLERAGHQTVVAQLERITRVARMTGSQYREVLAELAYRRERIEECSRTIDNSRCRLKQQFAKIGADYTEHQVFIPGPSGVKAC